MTYQKVVKVSKSLIINPSKCVHILRSVITVIHFPASGVWSTLSHCWTWMSIELLAPKFISEQHVWRGDLPVPTFGNWVLNAEWLSGLWNWPYVFTDFVFKIKKTWLLRYFELLHTFSPTLHSTSTGGGCGAGGGSLTLRAGACLLGARASGWSRRRLPAASDGAEPRPTAALRRLRFLPIARPRPRRPVVSRRPSVIVIRQTCNRVTATTYMVTK